MDKPTKKMLRDWAREHANYFNRNCVTPEMVISQSPKSVYKNNTNIELDDIKLFKWIINCRNQHAWILGNLSQVFKPLNEKRRSIKDLEYFNNISLLNHEIDFKTKSELLFLTIESLDLDKCRDLIFHLNRQWIDQETASKLNKQKSFFRLDPDTTYTLLLEALNTSPGVEPNSKLSDSIQKHLIIPTPTQTDHIDFYVHFLSGFRPDYLENLILKIKTKLRKQKFNLRNHEKKQYNLLLSKSLINSLDKHAKRTNVSRSAIIEQLINSYLNGKN